MKSRRFDNYERVAFDTDLWTLEPLTVEQNPNYVKWIRSSVVCHMDRCSWALRTFTERDRHRLIENMRKVFPALGKAQDGYHPDYLRKPRLCLFRRQTRISNKNIQVFIDWGRDYKRSPSRDVDGEISLYWMDKTNYSGYQQVLREMEHVVTVTQPRSWLCFAEIDLDTLDKILAQYMHNRVLLKSGRSNQLFHYSNAERRIKGGISLQADNWYQNAETSDIQVHSHLITNYPVDKGTGRPLYRLEIRLREKRIERLGACSIQTVISNQAKIVQDNLYWKDVKKDRIRSVATNDAELRALENLPVIYWVWLCVQRGITNRLSRRDYCIETKALPFKIV
jgi:hypothetical protein